MACNTSLTSILKDCSNNIGGITNFYVAPAEFVSATTLTTGTITAITMSGNSKFVEYQFTHARAFVHKCIQGLNPSLDSETAMG